MKNCGPGSSVGIAADCGLQGPGSNPRWRRDFPPVQTGYILPTVLQTRKPVHDILTSLWISWQEKLVQILPWAEIFCLHHVAEQVGSRAKASDVTRKVTVSKNGLNIEQTQWQGYWYPSDIAGKYYNLTQLICRTYVLSPRNLCVLSSGTVIL